MVEGGGNKTGKRSEHTYDKEKKKRNTEEWLRRTFTKRAAHKLCTNTGAAVAVAAVWFNVISFYIFGYLVGECNFFFLASSFLQFLWYFLFLFSVWLKFNFRTISGAGAAVAVAEKQK